MAIVVAIGTGTGTGIVAIAITIRSAGDTVTRERMTIDTGLTGVSVGIGPGRQLRRSDPIADTEACETVNMTVIAERIDAEVMTVTVGMMIAIADLVEMTATAAATVNAITGTTERETTEREGTHTPVIETETQVPGVIVIETSTASDLYDEPRPDKSLLPRSKSKAVPTVAMVTGETTPAEIITIATTHTIETVAHLLPAPRLAGRTLRTKRRNASAGSRKCNQMQTN